VAFRTVLGLDRAQPIVSQSSEGGEGGIQCIAFFRALPVESTLTREESLGATSTTLSPAAKSFWAKGRPMPLAPSTAQRRPGKRFAHRCAGPALLCGWPGKSPAQPILLARRSLRDNVRCLVGIYADHYLHASHPP
jgi:hypothetical protein